MSVLNAFACPVVYKYKVKLWSFSAFVYLILIIFTLIGPLIIVRQLGGFWLRNRVYVEMPKVNFMNTYSLLGGADPDHRNSLYSCLDDFRKIFRLRSYSANNDCAFVKAYEIDVDKDRKNDVLHFETHVRSNFPIRHLTLYLYFHIELRELVEVTIETPVLLEYNLPYDAQEINFVGDLQLQQKGTLREDNFPKIYNYTIDSGDERFDKAPPENTRKKFSPRLGNTRVVAIPGFSYDEPFVITGKIYYSEELIHYQPGHWEEIKWAWIQYFSFFLVFVYISMKIREYLFVNRFLKSFVIMTKKSE